MNSPLSPNPTNPTPQSPMSVKEFAAGFNLIPDGWDPKTYSDIPLDGKYNDLFNPNEFPSEYFHQLSEQAARETIRTNLSSQLGKPIVPRSALATRTGLSKYGVTHEDLKAGKVLVR